MTTDEYREYLREKHKGEDYGIFVIPTEGQEGLNILIHHFLGEDWYDTSGTTCTDQVNTEAIYEILEKYPGHVFQTLNRIEKIFYKIGDFVSKLRKEIS